MTTDKNIFIKNIYYMLTYAFQQLKQNNYEDIASEDFDEIFDLLTEILIRGISYQLKQGLHKEYISIHDTLPILKGKININGTIKNLINRKQKIDCDFDELSEDNIFNQILKTTAEYLFLHPTVKNERKESLKRLMLFFRGVQTIDLSNINWSKLRFDRNSKTYQMLLYICYFIFDNKVITSDKGNYKMRGFSDEHMCRLFEKFVLEYFKTHYPSLNARAAQINWNINEEKSSTDILPIMQTDIMLTLNNRTLIIDTKYYGKTMQIQFGKETIHNQNIYQIQSYVMNLDKSHSGLVDGMLLYAKTNEAITPNGQMSFADGNIIYFRTLDLNKDFQCIKNELDGFVKNKL